MATDRSDPRVAKLIPLLHTAIAEGLDQGFQAGAAAKDPALVARAKAAGVQGL
jgi:hypothetical protein